MRMDFRRVTLMEDMSAVPTFTAETNVEFFMG
jgi:hypothetical protein